jgi:hypothetical protein
MFHASDVVWDATGSPDQDFRILNGQNPARSRDLLDRGFEALGHGLGAFSGGYGGVVNHVVVEGGRRARTLLTNHDGALCFVKVVLRNPLSLQEGQYETFTVQGLNVSHGSDYSVQVTIGRVKD